MKEKILFDLIAKAGEKEKVNKLLTFNSAHLKKVWPEREDIIIEP
jgi:hypothetical protein